MQISKSHVLRILVYLLAVIFSIKCMKEPDFWWQWLTGDWILSHGQVPRADPFSYTMEGSPWVNIKWLSEVVFSVWNRIFPVELSVLMQAGVSCALIFFLFKTAQKLGVKKHWGLYLFLLLFLNIAEYRFNTRPEMFTHLFTLVSIYCIVSYILRPSRILYALIPLQILWQNTHEAFGVGLVIIGMLIVTLLISEGPRFFKKNKIPIITALAMLVGTLISPYGLQLLSSPYEIFTQLGQNKYTYELSDFMTAEYWDKTSILFWGTMLIYLILVTRHRLIVKDKRLRSFYILLILGFVYLALSAHRNIALTIIALSPMLLSALSMLELQSSSRAQSILMAVMLLLYLGVTTDVYYRVFGERYHYGLEVLSVQNPTGASDFMKTKNYKGSEIFSDYISSAYFMRYNEGFKSYIDLRDLDVFPTSFFEHYIHVINNMDSFFTESKKYNWKMVVLLRNSSQKLHSYLFNDSLFACVYVDPIAAVYEKTDDFTRDDIFTAPTETERSSTASVLQTILAPWHRHYDYSGYDADIDAAEYYFNVGQLITAEKRLQNSEYLHGQTPRSLHLSEKIQSVKWQLNQRN